MNQTGSSSLIDTILRVVVLFALIAWCVGIVLPFLEPVIWGAIIAITVYPLFAKLKGWMGGRNTLAAVLLTLLMLLILLAPTAWIIGSLLEEVQSLFTALGGNDFKPFILQDPGNGFYDSLLIVYDEDPFSHDIPFPIRHRRSLPKIFPLISVGRRIPDFRMES